MLLPLPGAPGDVSDLEGGLRCRHCKTVKGDREEREEGKEAESSEYEIRTLDYTDLGVSKDCVKTSMLKDRRCSFIVKKRALFIPDSL